MATDKNFTIKNGLTVGSTEIIDSSGNVDGRDVSDDGTKLDTIDTNADVTPSWVPSSDPSYLTSADGGNADTVDSLHASSFLRSDANDTATGTLTIGNAVYGNYTASNSDITGLIGGSTFGSLIQSQSFAHHVIGIRENDVGDSFAVVSGSGNYSSDSTYDKLVFQAKADGTLTANGGNTIWHAGNDGTGSGLDADLLDGLDSTEFQKISDKEFFSITNSGTTAGTWLGSHDDVSSYFDGMTIAFYQNNLAGAATTTLNINDIGAKTIYYANDAKLTTHYGARALIMLQYDSQQDRFYAHDFFYSDSNYNLRWNLDFTVNNSAGTGVAVHGYQMLIEGTDGKFYPCTEGGSSANTNSVSTVDLKIGGTMLMYNASNDYNANATLTSSAIWAALETSTMEFWNNRDSGWATADRPIYFVGTIQSNGSFKLDNTSYTSFLTQDLPTTDDGKIYIRIGWMANTYDSFRLENNHPIYVYKDGTIKEYAGYAEYAGDADTVDGIQASQFLRSDANDTTSGNLTVAGGELLVNKVSCNSGLPLVLNAGNANGVATGQTSELLYMNAEDGVQINSSTDYWVDWANRRTTTITGTRITVDGNYWEADDDSWNKFYTTDGYIQLGPANANHGHIYTDRPSFYFNKPLIRSGATVWDSANDGSGSGLHADLLDGQHGSYYSDYNNLSNQPSLLTLGTTSTTALAGDTALLALGTTSTTALAGDTALLALGTTSTTALAGNTSLLALGTTSTTALAGDTALLALGTTATTALAGNTALFSGSYTDLTNKPSIPTNNNQLTNGAGYVTTDTNTTYTAGGNYGMTLSGTEFRLENDRRRNSTTDDVYSGNTHDYTFYDASVGIRWYTTGTEEMRLEDDGDLHVDGNITAYSATVSDNRLKSDIKVIDNALEKVKSLGGYTFTYHKDEKKSAGVIAQEVEKVLPSAVKEAKLPFHGKENEVYKTVEYDQLVGLLIESVKELTERVEELEKKVGE